MGIQALQRFIETHCPTACVPVDLLKIAAGVRRPRAGSGRVGAGARLGLVVDGECCLDRLYGGYFSDWVCGGQWNRMVQFLAVLIQTIQNNNIELAVFFNGSLEAQRMDEWVAAQQEERKKITQVLKHVEIKGTPPPKVWWIPPVCLTTCLRMALRHLNITVVCTMDDHRQEVIAYCRENNFHGLMAEDAEYAIFDPPRYFSSQQLKLTYKGSLETKEFILDEVAKRLDLHPNRFCIFAALLGNYLLTEEDLKEFYVTLNVDKQKAAGDGLIKAVCDYVRALPSVDNLDVIGAQIFLGDGASSIVARGNVRVQKFKECVQYYLNGTKDGFLRYRPPSMGRKLDSGHHVSVWSAHQAAAANAHPTPGPDPAKFASETQESELSSLSAYKEATSNYGTSNPQIVIEPPSQAMKGSNGAANISGGSAFETLEDDVTADRSTAGTKLANGSSSESRTPKVSSVSGGYPYQKEATVYIPPTPPEVMRTASERHQKGLMSPWIYQVLTQGELKIPVCLEEDVPDELPNSGLLFRPVRQMVYAILFNLHHIQFQARQRQDQQHAASTSSTNSAAIDKIPDILVKEWVWSKYNQYQRPDVVKAESLGWAVPTVQRLWFGATIDDKKRRLRAFLTCLRSDTPLMLNTSYVPQHLLVMCCVLRYLLSLSEVRVLRRHELNAFLAQAVSPRLMDAQAMQGMQLPVVSLRAVELASLFMRGVETALFANDACGAPVPWLMCCPWLFFDGKLFHYKLLKCNEAKNLLELCEGQADQVVKVERMRQAILKGLAVEFARPPLPQHNRMPGYPPQQQQQQHHHPHHPMQHPAAFMHPGPPWPHTAAGRGRGNTAAGRRSILARGGQLEIAGVVVGQWGANYGTGLRGRGGGPMMVAPQVTSIGGLRKPKPGFVPRYAGGPPGAFNQMPVGRGMPSYTVRRGAPARGRRPMPSAPVTHQGPRKAKKATRGGSTSDVTKGSGNGTDGGKAAAGRGCTVQAGNKNVPVTQLIDSAGKTSGSLPRTVAEGQFDDAAAGAVETKPSKVVPPIIMKKQAGSVVKSAASDGASLAVTNNGDVTVAGGSDVSTANVDEGSEPFVIVAEGN